MLKMRLQRYGRKNDPSFRVVVLEGTEGPKSGNHVDQIGSYNAITKQKSLNKEKAAYWLSKGVQPSDTVYNFLVTEGVIQGKKKNVLPSKKPIVKEEPKVEAPVAAAPVVEEAPAPEAAPVEEAPAAETPAEEPTAVEDALAAEPTSEPAA
jgi:small subunit ribosomal protein S16